MKSRSSYGIFKYCTDCLDGISLSVNAPNRKKKRNQRRFWSGSKKKFAINMQGLCSFDETFSAVVCKHVGSANDADCFETCNLKKMNESLPFPCHWNGDPVYTVSETMMVPYPGLNLHILDPNREAINFYHSQIRIIIERVFGMFIQCWVMFWRSSRFSFLGPLRCR